MDSLNKTVKSGQSMALLPFLHPFDECCRSLIHSDGGGDRPFRLNFGCCSINDQLWWFSFVFTKDRRIVLYGKDIDADLVQAGSSQAPYAGIAYKKLCCGPFPSGAQARAL